MNILLVNNSLYPSGGDWSYVKVVAEIYKKYGHTVYMWGINRPNNQYTEDLDFMVNPINLHKAKKKMFKSFLTVFTNSIYSKEAENKMRLFLQSRKIDIVQLNNIRLGVTPSIIYPIKEMNIPIVWRMIDYYQICPNFRLRHHDTNCTECIGGKFYNCLKNNCKNSILTSMFVMTEAYYYRFKKTFDLIDSYSFQNFFTKDLFEKSGYPMNSCYVHYNPYNATNITPDYNFGNSILYFGRIEKEKGVFILAEAAQKLPNAVFNIVGKGSAEEELKVYIQNNNISNINLLGPKWGEELDVIIKESCCVVVPSIWPEVSSYVSFQAYANGRPVIASKIGGLPEVVIDNKTGYLFSSGDSNDLMDKIKRMLNDRDKAIEMGKCGRDFVIANHSPEKYYYDTINMFESLVNK